MAKKRISILEIGLRQSLFFLLCDSDAFEFNGVYKYIYALTLHFLKMRDGILLRYDKLVLVSTFFSKECIMGNWMST